MVAGGERLFVFAGAVLLVAAFSPAPQLTDNTTRTPSVLGTGRGIDHVGIVVRDLDDTVRVYRDVLGFTVPPGSGSFPGGVRNSAVIFGTNYLELITVNLSQAGGNTVSSDLAGFLKRREGASLLGLNVSSARQTADFLRARGFDVSEPQGSSYTPEGSKEAQPALWQTVGFKQPAVPSGEIFFIEYGSRNEAAFFAKRPEHPNTAVGIHSVWMAVKDLAAATNAYGSIGLRAGRKLQVGQLEATGQEVAAGQGVILLLQPNNSKGTLASFLAQYGEGIVGMTIEVRDLDAARTLLRAATGQELASYTTSNGNAILVSPNFTRGVWIEFFQRRG